ncbi:MAG: T9SS type A sorting domain-containing protein, partial [Candidatus Zixiibacteriota bacterium]
APVGSAVDRLALRCLTGHSGVASLTTDLITGVGDLSETLPVSFELGANYPNPFNPSTRIPYSLHVKGHVRIDVYNLLGEHVRTLIDRTQSSGAHEVEWDGISVNGVTAPSGMYFYRIRTKSFSSARKMLLLK